MTCNAYGRYNISRYGIISVFSLAIFIYATSFGRGSGIQQLYFPVACIAFILFERTEKLALAYGIVVPLILSIYLEKYGFEHPFLTPILLEAGILKLIFVALEVTTFAILLSAVFYLYDANEKSEHRLNDLLTELTKSESRSRAILSAVPDAVFRVSASGICLDRQSSEQYSLLFGNKDVLGRHINNILPFKFKDEVAQALAKVVATVMESHGGDLELNLKGTNTCFIMRFKNSTT